MRTLIREFVVYRRQCHAQIERDVALAYQVVRIGLMVKRKTVGKRTTVTMPKWEEVLRGTSSTLALKPGDSKDKGMAFMQMLAARAGSKVRKVKRTR